MNKKNSDWTFEDSKQDILNGLIKAANDEDSELNVIGILADYFNYANKEGVSDDEADDIFNFIHQTVSKPSWLNLNKGERIIKAAFEHKAEQLAKEELSF